jgi:predicted amino acid racemase
VFLDATLRRNPALIEAAVDLHREGRIPSNCYVIDVDTVAANARGVARAAREAGLTCFQMTKQFGRNPLVARAVADAGIERVVAVDFEEARLLHRHGLTLGHVGHLVQIPRAGADQAIAMQADYLTVFGVPQAAHLAAAARAAGREQDVLIRVTAEGDTFYPAQVGGVPIGELAAAAEAIDTLGGVRVAGVTSFPCVLFNEQTQALEPTQNLRTLSRAAEILHRAGVEDVVINAPSASCPATFELLAAAGATIVEPGSCLTGHTPLHAASDQPELPAMIYVSEITHQLGETTYTLGGGFYPRSRARHALVYGRAGNEPVRAGVRLDPPESIDYYGNLEVDPSAVAVGDTVVYAFRSQVFVSRSFVAVLGDVSGTPQVLDLSYSTGFPLGDDLLPAGHGAREVIA